MMETMRFECFVRTLLMETIFIFLKLIKRLLYLDKIMLGWRYDVYPLRESWQSWCLLMLRGAARRVHDTVTASARRTAPGSHRHYPNKSVSAAWLGWKSQGSVIDVPAVSANNTVILAILPSGEVIIWDIYLLHTVLARPREEICCCDDLYL